MKRKILILAALAIYILLTFAACNSMPDEVIIDGESYKLAFTARLYPVDMSFMDQTGIKVSGNRFHYYPGSAYDCYVSYDNNGEPNIYFKESEFDDALAYYTDSENFTYYCALGNFHDTEECTTHTIEDINTELFEKLLTFSHEKDYNPFALFKNEKDLKKVPVADPDNWTSEEIRFYKESKDGFFSSFQGHIYILLDGKLALLYYYDFGNEDEPVMLIREIPSELSDPDILINQDFGGLYE